MLGVNQALLKILPQWPRHGTVTNELDRLWRNTAIIARTSLPEGSLFGSVVKLVSRHSTAAGRVTVDSVLSTEEALSMFVQNLGRRVPAVGVFTVATKCLNKLLPTAAMKLWSRGIYEGGEVRRVKQWSGCG